MRMDVGRHRQLGRLSLFWYLLLALLAGCSGSDGLNIDCYAFEDEFEQTVETTVVVGEQFTVALCSKRNRGYRWSEEAQIDNPEVVQEVARVYEPGDSLMGGVPGEEIWTFRALQPGTAVISMEHRQLSGLNTEGVYTYRLEVTVTEAQE